jgi:hypothetical protein
LLHKEDTGTKEYLHFSTFNKQVVLHTAVIKIQDVDGKFHFCRCLVDSGAMSNYISQSLLQILRLNTTKQNISVCGINDLTTNIKQKVSTRIESRISRFRRKLEFLVVPKLTTKLPVQSFERDVCLIPKNLALADPNFNQASKVDILLGMEVFNEILNTHELKLGNDSLVARSTQFGYVIGGTLKTRSEANEQFCGLISNEEIHDQLKVFWEINDMKNSKVLNLEEQSVEQHYQQTHYRYADGRYGVHIPFKSNIDQLGNSKQNAIKPF